jgi:hypothetical protein
MATVTPPSMGVRRHSIVSAVVSGGQGPIYGSGGGGIPYQGNGGVMANWTASAGTRPSGEFLLYHSDRMWVGGDITAPSRVYWSSVGDPRDWSSVAPSDAGFVDLDPNDGDVIQGLGSIGPYVLVFKRRKTFLLYEPSLATGANRRLSDSVGCIAHHTIASSPYGTIFLAIDGLKVTDGQAIRDVGRVLSSGFKRVNPLNVLWTATGVYFKDHYYLSGLDVTDLGPILDWDIKNDSYWRHGLGAGGDVGALGMVVIESSRLGASLWVAAREIGGSTATRGIYDMFQTEDLTLNPLGDERGSDGVAAVFPWRAETGFHVFKQPNIQKRIREVRLDLDATSPPTVEMAFTPSVVREALDALIWETQVSGLPAERRYYTPGFGRACALRVSGSAGAAAEIFGYTIAAEQRAD